MKKKIKRTEEITNTGICDIASGKSKCSLEIKRWFQTEIYFPEN